MACGIGMPRKWRHCRPFGLPLFKVEVLGSLLNPMTPHISIQGLGSAKLCRYDRVESGWGR